VNRNENIIFYDGYCALCNRLVRFIIKKDREGIFRFSSLQSDTASKIIPCKIIDDNNTLVFKEGDKLLFKSEAAFSILRKLDTFWRFLLVFSFMPAGLTDRIYDFIAGTRYRIFKRYDSCPLPPKAYRSRFLNATDAK